MIPPTPDAASTRTRRLRPRAGERAPVTEPEAAPASPAPGARRCTARGGVRTVKHARPSPRLPPRPIARRGNRTPRGGGYATAPRPDRWLALAEFMVPDRPVKTALPRSLGRTRRPAGRRSRRTLLVAMRWPVVLPRTPARPLAARRCWVPNQKARRLRHRSAGGARRPCRAPGTVGGTATRPGVRPGPVSTGGVSVGGEPDAAERRRGRLSPVAASFGSTARPA